MHAFTWSMHTHTHTHTHTQTHTHTHAVAQSDNGARRTVPAVHNAGGGVCHTRHFDAAVRCQRLARWVFFYCNKSKYLPDILTSPFDVDAWQVEYFFLFKYPFKSFKSSYLLDILRRVHVDGVLKKKTQNRQARLQILHTDHIRWDTWTAYKKTKKKADKRECRYYTLDHIRGDTWTAKPIKFSKTNLLFTKEVTYQGLPIHGHVTVSLSPLFNSLPTPSPTPSSKKSPGSAYPWTRLGLFPPFSSHLLPPTVLSCPPPSPHRKHHLTPRSLVSRV